MPFHHFYTIPIIEVSKTFNWWNFILMKIHKEYPKYHLMTYICHLKVEVKIGMYIKARNWEADKNSVLLYVTAAYFHYMTHCEVKDFLPFPELQKYTFLTQSQFVNFWTFIWKYIKFFLLLLLLLFNIYLLKLWFLHTIDYLLLIILDLFIKPQGIQKAWCSPATKTLVEVVLKTGKATPQVWSESCVLKMLDLSQ